MTQASTNGVGPLLFFNPAFTCFGFFFKSVFHQIDKSLKSISNELLKFTIVTQVSFTIEHINDCKLFLVL